MKKYKLVKDLPTFKAGDIFYLSGMGDLFHESEGVVAYSWSTIDKFPNILTDWFEEIKTEPTRWKPKYTEEYYYLAGDGHVCRETFDDDFDDDNDRFEIGNCFQTEEEAEQVAEYLKALAVVRGDATTKFVKDNENWCACYDSIDNSLYVSNDFYKIRNGIFGLPYFSTSEDAQKSIELHEKEWLTIFGIEEGHAIKK